MTRHPSFDATLGWDHLGGTAYDSIGQVKDIGGPNISRDTIEVTDRDLPDNYKIFWGGYADGGELTFQLNWDPKNNVHIDTAGTGLLADFEDQDNCTLAKFRLRLDLCGGTADWEFSGVMTQFNTSSPEQGANTADCTVKVSGKPALTVT